MDGASLQEILAGLMETMQEEANKTLNEEPDSLLTATSRTSTTTLRPLRYTVHPVEPQWVATTTNASIIELDLQPQLSASDFWQYEVAVGMETYFYPIILVLGTIGNILTYNVMLRPRIGLSSATSYIKFMTIFNTVNLWMGIPRHWAKTVLDFDIRKTDIWVCRLHRCALYTCLDVSVWLLVAITIDRVIAVVQPYRASSWCTRRRARGVLLFLIVTFTLFNLQVFFTYENRYDESTTILKKNGTGKHKVVEVCVIVGERAAWYNTYIHPWLVACIYTIGPFAIMVVGNALVARGLYQRSDYRRKVHTGNSSVSYTAATQRNTKANKTMQWTTGEDNARNSDDENGTARNGTTQAILPPPPLITVDRSANAKLRRASAVTGESMETVRTTTLLLFLTCFMFFVLCTPAFLQQILEPYYGEQLVTYPKGQATYRLLYTSARLFLYLDHSLHFALFTLSAKRFREEFFKMVGCAKDNHLSNILNRVTYKQRTQRRQSMATGGAVPPIKPAVEC